MSVPESVGYYSREAHFISEKKKVMWSLRPSSHHHTWLPTRKQRWEPSFQALPDSPRCLLYQLRKTWLLHGQINEMNHPNPTWPHRCDLHTCPLRGILFSQAELLPFICTLILFCSCFAFLSGNSNICEFVCCGMNTCAVLWVTTYLTRLNHLLLFVSIFHCQLKLVSRVEQFVEKPRQDW